MGGKESQEQAKNTPARVFGVPQKQQAKNHNKYAEGLVQNHAGPYAFYFSLCKPI